MSESCNSTNIVSGEEVSFNGKNYVLTFEDNFEGDKLDSQKWEKCPQWERQAQMENHGWWADECSYVKDGNLVIEGKRKDGKLISGGVRTSGIFEQANGLYKIRFKAEKTSGIWYAFWLMSHTVRPNPNGAINGGEIDVFELIPNDINRPEGKRSYINSAVHWNGYGAEHKSKGSSITTNDDFYDNWHEVTFEWTKDYYKAYLDNSTTPFWNTEGQAKEWGGIVKTKNYIKITAEFGSWAGPLSDSDLPSHMYVDWVKVYKEM